MKEEEPTEEIPFLAGQVVEITEGPFSDFSGTVEEVLADKGKVRVTVSLFGRRATAAPMPGAEPKRPPRTSMNG